MTERRPAATRRRISKALMPWYPKRNTERTARTTKEKSESHKVLLKEPILDAIVAVRKSSTPKLAMERIPMAMPPSRSNKSLEYNSRAAQEFLSAGKH
jgi:hypothetical protein